LTLVSEERRKAGVARKDASLAVSVAKRVVRNHDFGIGAAAIVIYAFFAITSWGKGFVSVAGTASWLNTASQLGIIAVPLALLMISGSFDLSIGSMVGAGSITVGIVSGYMNYGLWLSIVIAAAIALMIGLGNGVLVTRTGLPSFIVTLAANLVVAGLGLTLSRTITNTTSITITTSGFAAKLFNAQWGQFEISNLWWLVISIIGAWILAKTRTGNWILATGGDHERARQAGVLTSRVSVLLFVATAFCATFVGVLQAVQYSTGDPTVGQGYVFQTAIVVIVGGVLITGGYGTILGVVIATMIYGIVDAGLFYTGWDTDLTQVWIGALLVVVVLMNKFLRNLAVSGMKNGRLR
jgi:simple sugar transport system permease protein